MRNHWAEIEKYLEDQKIAQELIGELRDFHMRYEVEDQVKERVEKPDILFYGKKILEMSIAALLQGDNLLLSGAKATGKNVLCETLAWIFGRPEYDISFHVNTDSADLIGTDTFINNDCEFSGRSDRLHLPCGNYMFCDVLRKFIFTVVTNDTV